MKAVSIFFRFEWDKLLENVHCLIISVTKTDKQEAYILRWVITTRLYICVISILLLCIPCTWCLSPTHEAWAFLWEAAVKHTLKRTLSRQNKSLVYFNKLTHPHWRKCSKMISSRLKKTKEQTKMYWFIFRLSKYCSMFKYFHVDRNVSIV